MIKRIIIGIIFIGLIVQTSNVHAIYSPTISQRVNLIKQHVLSAQSQNGVGGLTEAVKTLKELDDERRAKNTATSLPGDAGLIHAEVIRNTFTELIAAPWDNLFMIFNIIFSRGEAISNCLRDDIWMLMDLKDAVVQEMLKSYMMLDKYHGDLLADDYRYLISHINILKTYGMHPEEELLIITQNGVEEMTTNEYLFGSEDARNYYKVVFPPDANGCPDGDFQAAFEEVWNAIQNLAIIGSGSGSDWGSIWDMAKARARRRAAEWIEANQISLSIGGEGGANPFSLFKNDGWDRFTGKVMTELTILKNTVVGPVVPLFEWAIYSGGESDSGCVYYWSDYNEYRPCTEAQERVYETCLDDPDSLAFTTKLTCRLYKNTKERKTALKILADYKKDLEEHEEILKEVETAFVYHVELNSVGEQSLIDVSTTLTKINGQIERGYEATGKEAGPGITTIISKLSQFSKKHCSNKGQ
ncbi:hypothetical protein KJ742_00125 [Patescibacteria group bacterium]|nr:hypothetical protein [Patescibacteria group bacterium]